MSGSPFAPVFFDVDISKVTDGLYVGTSLQGDSKVDIY